MSTKRWEPGYVSVTDENGTWTPPAPVHEAGPKRDIKWAPQIMDRATWLDQTGEGATAPMSDNETAVLTSLAEFHGVSLAEVESMSARIEDLTRKIMENVHAAIDVRLRALAADGISIDRISIEQRPDGSTAIVVDNIPDSSFRITYADDRR